MTCHLHNTLFVFASLRNVLQCVAVCCSRKMLWKGCCEDVMGGGCGQKFKYMCMMYIRM